MNPMAAEEYWAVPEIAEYLGITESSVRVYAAKRDDPPHMPAPDNRFGATNVWKPDTIRKWRPGKDESSTAE